MNKTKEFKLMIIENFIDYFTSNEAERIQMKESASLYVEEDHVDEIGTLLEVAYHKIDTECISETDTVRMISVSNVLAELGANVEEMV